ncbi:MAG: hypothetical protein IJO65_12105 [Lachnospiraceae bacterium]|nr:hypothetical protein [Lachnospiraceae bacterium]
MKNNKWKNNLDEMQEQKLLHIERNGCWFSFWPLFISLMVQTIVFDDFNNFYYVAGEWIIFMCLALYLGIACMKNGIWDRRFKADAPTNLVFSLIAGVVVFVVIGLITYKRSGMLAGSVATGVIAGGFTFVLCAASMFACTVIYKKRVAKLESEEEIDNE